MENALCLTRFSSHVHIIHRRDRLRVSKAMQKLVFHHEKISIVWNTHVKDILGDDTVKGLMLEEAQTGTYFCPLLRAFLLPSVITLILRSLELGSKWMIRATFLPTPALLKPALLGFLPAAMPKTKSIVKPLRQQAQPAWSPWKQSGGYRKRD